MAADPGVPPRFPLGGTRAVAYAVQTRSGRMSGAALHTLAGLRAEMDHVLVVAGPLDATGRAQVSALADEIVTVGPETQGLWAYAHALRVWGPRAEAFDEIVLTSDAWFGPVSPLGPVLQRLESRYVDVWSLTDRRDVVRGDRSEGRDGVVRLSAYWLAARRRVRQSQAWKQFWSSLPARPDQDWRVREIENRFSDVLTADGFRLSAAFSSDDYPAEHADMFNVDLLIEDGCPSVPRAVFDGYPLFFDQHAIIGRRLAAAMAEHGYPVASMWSDLAQRCAPKRLHTTGAMLEVIPPVRAAVDTRAARILAIIHVVDLDALTDVVARLSGVRSLQRVVLTLSDGVTEDVVTDIWDAAGPTDLPYEIRPARSRVGADTVVAFDECRDLLLADDVDLVLALHTGTPSGLTRNARDYFRRQQIDCLLGHGPAHLAQIVDLFDRDPSLGLVVPPTPHIGMSSLGEGWAGHRDAALTVLDRLGITVPVDWASPHAPIGGMWMARPQAVRALSSVRWTHDVAAGELCMRLPAYAAGEAGFVSRTVATSEHAGLSHASLEYIGDHMAMTSYGYPAGYTNLLHRAGPVGSGRAVDFTRMWLRYRHPRVWSVVARAASAVRVARRLQGRLTGRRR